VVDVGRWEVGGVDGSWMGITRLAAGRASSVRAPAGRGTRPVRDPGADEAKWPRRSGRLNRVVLWM